MTSITVTEARKQLYALLDDVAESHHPVRITGKRATGVLISEEDWQAIDNAFLANDDPLFGSKRRKEFSGLFTKIVSMTPAPFGLGEPTRQ